MKRIITSLFALLLVTLIYGQSVPFINNSPDSYTLSMGGASSALKPTAFAIFNNIGAVSLSEKKISAAVSYSIWQPSASNNRMLSASGYVKSGKRLGIALSAQINSHQPYDITDENGYISSQFYPSESAITLGISYRLADFLSLGISGKYISSNLGGEKSASAFGGDIGLYAKLSELSLGLTATNIGTKINYGYSDYNLPSMVRLGAGYNFNISEYHAITATVEGNYLLHLSALMGGAGIEYSFRDMVSVRAGYHYGDNKSIPSYSSVGAGVNFSSFQLNFAYLLSSSVLKNTFSLSICGEF